MFDVVTIGSATKDLFLFTNDSSLKPGINGHFLEIPSDKKIEIDKKLAFSGGSATNAAATFAKFGKSVAAIAKVGRDDNGRFILDDLRSRGIVADYMIESEGETPFSDVLVSKNGHMVLFIYRGIESTLSIEDIKLDFKSKWLYIGPLAGESHKILPDIVSYCKENGIKIVFNPGAEELNLKLKRMESLLKDIDVVSMNNDEAKQFAGYENDIKNILKLSKSVKRIAIITRGDKGCLVMDGNELYDASAFNVKQTNFVGAGDAFLSGFINALIDEKDTPEAIALGSFNASNVVKFYGAKDGIINEYPKQKLKMRRIKYEKNQV